MPFKASFMVLNGRWTGQANSHVTWLFQQMNLFDSSPPLLPPSLLPCFEICLKIQVKCLVNNSRVESVGSGFGSVWFRVSGFFVSLSFSSFTGRFVWVFWTKPQQSGFCPLVSLFGLCALFTFPPPSPPPPPPPAACAPSFVPLDNWIHFRHFDWVNYPRLMHIKRGWSLSKLFTPPAIDLCWLKTSRLNRAQFFQQSSCSKLSESLIEDMLLILPLSYLWLTRLKSNLTFIKQPCLLVISLC